MGLCLKCTFAGAAAGLCLLLAVPAEGSAQDAGITAISPRQETYPSLTPDGRYLIYSSDASGVLNLYRLDLTTREVVRLTGGDFEDSAASWSPDGKKIVFQREDGRGQRDLWEINSDGADPRNLTNTADISEQHPRYSPDGALIIFDSNRPGPTEDGSARIQNYEIYSMSLSDGSLSRLTEWYRWDMYASFSPDGERVVWRRALQGAAADEQNFEIFVKDLRTGQETNLTNHPAYDGNPHWSPLGDWIVFISAREGSSDVYVVRPDGSDLRRLTTGAGRTLGYARPSFSQNGSTIVANRVIAGVTDIVVIELPQVRSDR